MKKLLCLATLLVCTLLLVLLVGCGSETAATEDTTAQTVASTQATTAPVTTPETTEALVTTAPETTKDPLTENGIPKKKLAKVSELVGEKDFKNEALALMKLIIRDYYDLPRNRVLDGNGNQITLWAVGSFLEALTSVYKAFPDDADLKKR